jgi:hypothetical protein
METVHDMFLWIGRAVNPAILLTLFNIQSLEGIDMSKLQLQAENSDFSFRVNAVIEALRADRARYMQLHMIKEGVYFVFVFLSLHLLFNY